LVPSLRLGNQRTALEGERKKGKSAGNRRDTVFRGGGAVCFGGSVLQSFAGGVYKVGYDSEAKLAEYWQIPPYTVINKNKMQNIIAKTTTYSVFCK
jgi:hypothetical protein